jgi:acyl-coenzyme A synthetase/AMP-(fatty) acid ligase
MSWNNFVAESIDLLSVLAAARAPWQTVGWRRGEALSFESFRDRVAAWCLMLEAKAGGAYALYLDDSIELAAALFGAWQAGKTIYLPGDNLPATCASLRQSVDGYLGEFAAVWQPQTPAIQGTAARNRFHRLDPDFIGIVLYTSGTTGAAQAIPKKLRQLAAEVAVLEAQFGTLLGGADIAATVSHQHIYGLLFKVLWPFTVGRAIHAENFPFFEELTGALTQRDCVLVSSPAHLKRLHKNAVSAPAVNSLRAVFSSGGPLPLEVARECESLLGQVPIEVYGSSETGGVAWRRQAGRSDQAWTPFPAVQWRIDPADEVLEVSSAYLPTAEWFRTADRAAAVADDRFFLCGRVDQIAKIEGKRISLSAIESLLASSPLVEAARVIVVEGTRQRLAAFIVPSALGRGQMAQGGRLDFGRRLRQLLVDSIEPVGLPRLWRYLEALPVNAQGKTTFAELSALLDHLPRRSTQPRKHLIEKSSNEAIFEIVAPRDLLYFDGHFSGRPILPGVAQLDWVIACGRECFALPAEFRGIHGLKFHRVIPPETPVRLEIAYDRVKSSLNFQITSALGRHAAGRVLFGNADV